MLDRSLAVLKKTSRRLVEHLKTARTTIVRMAKRITSVESDPARAKLFAADQLLQVESQELPSSAPELSELERETLYSANASDSMHLSKFFSANKTPDPHGHPDYHVHDQRYRKRSSGENIYTGGHMRRGSNIPVMQPTPSKRLSIMLSRAPILKGTPGVTRAGSLASMTTSGWRNSLGGVSRAESVESLSVRRVSEQEPGLGRNDEDTDPDTGLVTFNVGGSLFYITKEALDRYPDTLLGALTPAAHFYNSKKRQYFFDRNPTVFPCILDLYRNNELHLPKHICGNAVIRELEFWEIPAVWVAACCWSNIHEALNDERLLQDLQRRSSCKLDSEDGLNTLSFWKAQIWVQLYSERANTKYFQLTNYLTALLILVALSVFYFDARTEIIPDVYYKMYYAQINATEKINFDYDSLPSRRNFSLHVAGGLLMVVMLWEILLKMVTCPDLWAFCTNLIHIVYIVSLVVSIACEIAEYILSLPENWTDAHELDDLFVVSRTCRFLIMIRSFELLDRTASLRVMWIATKRCTNELTLLFIVFIVATVFFGSMAYFFELHASNSDKEKSASETGSGSKPRSFAANLEHSFYWAIITMTTVGYGDITPQTTAGRVIGALASISGVIVLAMPVAVLTESFQQYHLRQQVRKEKHKQQEVFWKSNFLTPSNNQIASEMCST